MSSRVYFAHPVNSYNTELERAILTHIHDRWPGKELINPSDQVHRDHVARLKASDPEANVMSYFLALAQSCDVVVALPFPDGKFGAGVFQEAFAVFSQRGKYVFGANPHTRKLYRISALSPTLALSVEETRKRVYFTDRTIRPFA